MAREGVEIETGPNPQAAVIWLHGLGADGHDFEPIVPELVQRSERALRFVFPHAPMRPVTLNAGYVMRAWYDIIAIDRRAAEDESGIRASQALITELTHRENARGIAQFGFTDARQFFNRAKVGGRAALAARCADQSDGYARAGITRDRSGNEEALVIGMSKQEKETCHRDSVSTRSRPERLRAKTLHYTGI